MLTLCGPCADPRAELVTGRYFHNIRVDNPGDRGCMSVKVSAALNSTFYADYYFAPHLQQAGYTVGKFISILPHLLYTG